MINACFIVKYPPIQGGVSMSCYWIARQLAERGHHIFIVTNANEVEDEYRIYLDESDKEWYEPRFESSGGFVKVHTAQALTDAMMHIPQSNPFETKLASIATNVIRRNSCDVIFSYYFQPYGISAHLASQWTGVPYLLKHAGSDLGRLMRHRDLTTAYREILKAADCVWVGLKNKEPFLATGVKEEKIWLNPISRVPSIFSPEAVPMDLNGYLNKLSDSQSKHVRNVLINTTPIDLSKPTIGIYGKVGEVKGSFDLLAALGLLKKKGLDFNFLALTQGRALETFKLAVGEHDLQDRTWIFPFVPHWKVPGFIRSCTAVCFLEREFPITFHGPTIPREILACGTCLILSKEIAEKQYGLKNSFLDGDNILMVEDPQQHSDLARKISLTIENPDLAISIGLRGRKLYCESESTYSSQSNAPINGISNLEAKFVELRDARKVPLQLINDGVNSVSDIAARAERLRKRLPLSSALLKRRWDALIRQYCESPIASANQFEDAVMLCEFLESQAAKLDNGFAYLDDVIKYEKTHNLLLVDLQDSIHLKPAGAGKYPKVVVDAEPWPGNSKENGFSSVMKRDFDKLRRTSPNKLLDLKPIRNSGVMIETFSYDLKPLPIALRKGEAPKELPREDTFIIFKKELNFIGVELQVSEATKRFLDLCDGRHTVNEILSYFGRPTQVLAEADVSTSDLLLDIAELLNELIMNRIIRLLDGSANSGGDKHGP